MAILCDDGRLTPADVPFASRPPGAALPPLPAGVPAFLDSATYEEFKEASERAFLARSLERHGWNIQRTARLLGMQRSNLYKKMEKYGLKREETS
jgi:transcriptional regulator of acetoin/glycerol metabolism